MQFRDVVVNVCLDVVFNVSCRGFTVDFNLEHRDSTPYVDVDVKIECSMNVALDRNTFFNGKNQTDCS